GPNPGFRRLKLLPEASGMYGRPAALPVELRVEGDSAGREVDPLHEGRRLARAVLAIHARVLPFHAQRAAIPHVVQRDDDLLEVHVPVAQRAEIPVPPRVGERRVPAEDADVPVAVAPPD